MRILLVLALTVAVLVSGCADDSREERDDSTGGPAAPVNNTTAPLVMSGTGAIVASGGVVSFSEGGLTIQVPGNATLLHVEIAWEDPIQDIHLGLSSPSARQAAGAQEYDHIATGGAPTSPDSPHSLTIPDPEAGAWSAGATANGASGRVDYRLAATVFLGETAVPDGYSAL